MNRIVLVVGGIAVVGLLAVGVYTWYVSAHKTPAPAATDTAAATPPTQTTSTLKSATASDFDKPISDQLTAATTKAKLWEDDAVLHYVSVELPSDLSVTNATDTYVFGSAKDASDWWTYSFAEKTSKSVRAIIPKEDYLGSAITPINTSFWKMNYVEAFQLADANGGADFRTQHTDAKVTLFLSTRDPNQWLWWTAEYKTPAGDLLTLLVNPNRGEVVDSTGKQVAAPPTTSGTSNTTTPSTSATDSTSSTSSTTGSSNGSTTTNPSSTTGTSSTTTGTGASATASGTAGNSSTNSTATLPAQ